MAAIRVGRLGPIHLIDAIKGPWFIDKGINNKNAYPQHEWSRSVVVELLPFYHLVHGSMLHGSNFFAKYNKQKYCATGGLGKAQAAVEQ
jgi:hypothetical protein